MNKLVGNTPMIKINYEIDGVKKEIYAKLEYYNVTGSIKDRIVYNILDNEREKGNLKHGQPIIEATSGNTGIALASYGACYKHPVYIFMPVWSSEERRKLMQLYGANLILITHEDGGFKKCIEEAKKKAKELNGFLLNQFENNDNVLVHKKTTAKEIIAKVPFISSFVSGIGTGGTFMGIALGLKEHNKMVKAVALEPASIPILSGGEIIGPHKISGIGDDFIPNIVDPKIIDRIIDVSDDDALRMARKVASELGIAIGISSGANVFASILTREQESSVVTVIPDDAKKYLSTDLLNDITDSDFTSKIKFLDYEVI